MSNYTALTETHRSNLPHPQSSFSKHIVHLKQDSDNLFEIGFLFKRTILRTITNVLPYLFTQIVIIISLIFGTGLIILNVVLHIFLYLFTNSVLITVISGLLFFLLISTVFLYLFTWAQLTSFYIFTKKQNTNIFQSFKNVKPLIWKFMAFQAIFSIFMFGLIPFHIISLGLTFILWQIWSIFTYFIFLKDQPNGLDSLWRSYHMVNDQPWNIFGKIIILFLIYAVIILTINIFSFQNSLFYLIQSIFFFLTWPFTVAYLYEIYNKLPKQRYAVPNKNWVKTSLFGWLITGIVTLIIFLILLQDPTLVLNLILSEQVQVFVEEIENTF